jgi:putative component of membrane protein insertase Oxa1/YidC/SpoIIIJ protein YidD
MCEETPDRKEQDLVWEYCQKRELYRPDTTIKKMLKYAVTFTFGVSGAAVIISILMSFPLPFVVIVCFLLGLIICSKKIIIGIVRLYQHYAPEDVRRKCLLMPTCSEYMILAVQKYGTLQGLYKGIYRLLITCKGTVYRIDYP